ncbi:hypothetical protein DFP72DRAFT_747193, partial [Ephemerocybe angulata]
SIRSLFPDVEAAHITAIITHEFRGIDLHKLDSRYRDKDLDVFISADGSIERRNKGAKDYKSFDALYQPLITYFAILSAHIPNQRTIPFVFFQFLIHLQKITKEYEWTVVLEYTMIFFNRRRMEMLEGGDYSRWGIPDASLMAEYVYAHRKAAVRTNNTPKASGSNTNMRVPSVCRNWNEGKCTGTGKCPSGRSHVCSSCGKSEH